MKNYIKFFVIAIVAMTSISCNNGSSSSNNSNDTVQQEGKSQEQDPTTKWNYSSSVDDLTGKTTGIDAFIASTNTQLSEYGDSDRLIIQLGYNGISGKPTNMFGLAFEKGKCRFASKNSQGFYAVFDDGEVDNTWTLCNGGNNKSIVMISDGLSSSENKIRSFINKLKQSKTCRIQVNIEGVGMKTFNFNCEGLNWDY